MKQYYLKQLMTALLLLCCTVASAQVFEVDGIYYNILPSEDKTVEVTSGSNKYTGAVTIPASVTYNSTTYGVIGIGDGAFAYCSGLTSVEIPSSVTSIGSSAFYDCDGLTSIEIPSSVTIIGERAFYDCTSLTSIEIPSSVTIIGKRAFYDCTSLTSIEIPSSVTSIGERAFYYCYGLTSIVVDEGNSVYDSRGNCNAIIETASNTLIAGCVNTIIPEGVTSIGESAFEGCSILTIEIPASVTSIGIGAFWSCYSLTSINIPAGVTSIGYGAFRGCTGLTSIVVDEGNSVYDSRGNCNAIIETASNTLILGCVNTIIPASVTSIGESAFRRCTGLTSIEIPAGVTSIGNDAFYFCAGLTSITSHIAAENLFAPGNNAFSSVNKSACTLYVPAGAKSTYAATDGWKEFTNIVEFNGKCGDNAYWALNEETGALTIFGEGAIYDYVNNDANHAPWYSNRENITSVTIEEGVTSIGNSAFADCTGLTSIEIPSSVTSIGESAFFYCPGLTSIEIPSSVTSIGYYAFAHCTVLTSIEIPSSVTSIGNYTFYNCDGLTSIVVDEGNSVYDSRGNCNAIIETASNTLIAGCNNTIIPEGVTSIGESAFDGCDGLTSIVIPASVTSIGKYAFWSCYGLTSINIPAGVTSIGKYALYGCTSLTSIVVGDGNSVYDSRGNCNAIIETASNTLIAGCKNTIIPASVTSIGEIAFAYCDYLTSIEIPSSVTSIGDYAFIYCTGLTSITSHIAAENLFAPGNNAFYYVDKTNCTLYVPAGAKSTYASTDGWKDFTNIVELKVAVNLVDGEPYTSTEPMMCSEVTYTRTFNNTNWQAWYVPFAIEYEQLSRDFEVAKINNVHQSDSDDDGIMDATYLEVIKLKTGTLKANYPYLVRAKAAGEKRIAVNDVILEAAHNTSIDCSSVELKYYFVGTLSGVSGPEMYDNGYYAFSGGSLMQAVDNTVNLKPFRWYMNIEARGSAVSPGVIKIRVKGETTDIDAVVSEEQTEVPVYYDLSGRRVENPTRGIYIVNGKKVLVK